MSKTYEPIAAYTVTGNPSQILFSNISSNYTDLILVTNLRTSSGQNTRIQFNGDTGTNYSTTRITGNGSATASARTSSAAFINIDPISNSDGTNYQTTIVNIMSYANTNTFKTILMEGGNAAVGVSRSVGLWRSLSAVTSINVYISSEGETYTGGTVTLYGIKSESPVLPLLTESTKTASSVSAIISNYDAGLTYTLASTAGTATRSTNTVTVSGLSAEQNITLTVTATDGNNSSSSNTISLTSSPVATGGTTTLSGGYRYHTFTSSGTFTLNAPKSVDYVIVAGGGAGGFYLGGGGGAGGYIQQSSIALSANSYSVTVGGGGATSTAPAVSSSSGTGSSFNSVSTTGGGKGANGEQNAAGSGAPGGSGGGSGGWGSPGNGTPGQGNPGGGAVLINSSYSTGGGGGGASAAGGNASNSPFNTVRGGNGGAGTQWLDSVFYAGGGGGAIYDAGTTRSAGSGGIGGGGAGAFAWYSGAGGGGTNTGGGGGGGGANNSPGNLPIRNGGNGGSGVVVIRYLV